MADTEAQLRERIAALEDRELARMLTLNADDYRVEALRIAGTEAQARNLDVERIGAELRVEERQCSSPIPRDSFVQVERLDWSSLAPVWPWLVITAAAFGLELWIVATGKLQARSWMSTLTSLSVVGMLYYLVSVWRLVSALRRATRGGFPVTPGRAAGYHLIPLFNLVWPFQWGSAVSRFAERNGRGRAIDRYVPGALFLLSILLLRVDTALRTLVLGTVVVYVQLRLKSNMRLARLEAEPDSDWSSSATG